ncbi:excisionase family DNA binding protein [Microbacterium sp. AG1240]|uniref:helix-turn-helix domain-containing protein n=1 Tax=Microbacterium sp. AG1240 TaxID=2183992 RepID=UPI000F29F9C5|nr:helix-turn-helix domain-containing protein [Microbacterium sp. AG1240]RKT36810.1 excisionase family DNA binding protein [Microbacterium sp. AG1240]
MTDKKNTPSDSSTAAGWKQLALILLEEQTHADGSSETAKQEVYENAARDAGMSLRVAEMLPDLLTPEETATYLSVSKNTLYGWRKDGYGPPAVLVGKHLRFPKSALTAWSIQKAA